MNENELLKTAGVPLLQATKALILIHGRGASAESILPLADALDATDYAVLAPQAAMSQWYPNRFTTPREQNEPYLGSALRMLQNLIKKLNDAEIKTEDIVLAGFSQGACLASEFVALNPTRYRGLLVFSGGLIGTGTSVTKALYKGSLDQTPVFMGCSDVDFHIPLDRFKASGQILSQLGAKVELKIYKGMDHTIIQDEIDQAKVIL